MLSNISTAIRFKVYQLFKAISENEQIVEEQRV
jgi:hypothetical protein